MLIAVLVFTYSLVFLWQVPEITSTIQSPPNFPSDIPITMGTYENWSFDLTVRNLWIATPLTPEDVVRLANWAYDNGYTLRASGYMHNWSPLTVTAANNKDNVVLVDTTQNLVKMQVTTSSNPSISAVKAQTGTSMDNLLTFLEQKGLGLYAVPSAGYMTLGGVLAINGHGTGIPAMGETIAPGHSYGTLSNLIISLTAVVWDSYSFVLKTFERCDTDAKAFLVQFGRAFITEVTLMVGDNYNLRCLSRTDISSKELFADPTDPMASSYRTFSKYLNETGRVSTILFPFTTNPWLKVWSISPTKPLSSTKVTKPYNYPFSDNIPKNIARFYARITNRFTFLTPKLGKIQIAAVTAGLLATSSSDIWGPSKNLLLSVKPTSLRLTEMGCAVITRRSNVQKVINSVMSFYNDLLNDYAQRSIYPLAGPVEIRATHLDQPGVIRNGESPAFSVVRPINNEFDVAVWFDFLGFKNAPFLYEALGKIEWFMFSAFDRKEAIARSEWSKGWAFTASTSAWSNSTVYRQFIPSSFSTDEWNAAVSILNKYDPHEIFINEFLGTFLVPV